LIDVCAYIDADLVISKLGVLGLLPNVASAVANLDLCLCASAFPLNIQDYTSLSVLASILGDDEVTALLTALINDGPGSSQCTYPAHSSALCSQSDPCGFTCGSGYVVQGDQCVCPPPLSEKNGQCGTFP
ncbi:uncharacterized protein STEHIDRAFT_43867, partial [Stereum hirsutum FP-91666 SS1]|uniref:uncharacterized protein n=1 Tax=Stereum hirsutum (strain FP-91666) TaxID=721885 RepID=UPI0004449E2C